MKMFLTAGDRSHLALIVQLAEHCTCIAKVVRSNPVQSLKMFWFFFSSSVMAAFEAIACRHLIATVGHLLLTKMFNVYICFEKIKICCCRLCCDFVISYLTKPISLNMTQEQNNEKHQFKTVWQICNGAGSQIQVSGKT